MGRQRPGSVTWVIRVQVVLVLLSGVATAAVAVLEGDLVRAWAESQGGLGVVLQSQIQPPAFVPVAVVSFVVYALLVWVLTALFAHGHRWARYALAGTALSSGFTMLVLYRADPPAPLLALGVPVVVLNGVLLWLLASRDTAEFIRGAQLADAHEHSTDRG